MANFIRRCYQFSLFFSIMLGVQQSSWSEEVRALWVTRWDFKTAQDVHSIVQNAASLGFTDVLFQVRGNGTVFYPSRIEPWGWELTGDDPATTGQDPGWDPLATVIREGQTAHIRIHAYINVFPGWRGTVLPPKSSKQLWVNQPDWFMVDVTGKRMKPTEKWYAFLTPTRPDVRDYLKGLFTEIASYEGLDGISLDYFRFADDYQDVAKEHYPKATKAELAKHADFSYDRVSLSEFEKTYGTTPAKNAIAWDNFRRDGVTRTLHAIRDAMGSRLKNMTLSSAVMADLEKGRNLDFQDSAEWVRRDWLDWVLPMNYSPKQYYDERLDALIQAVGKERAQKTIVVGINAAHGVDELVREVELARKKGCPGHAVFAYSLLFPEHKANDKAKAFAKKLYAKNK